MIAGVGACAGGRVRHRVHGDPGDRDRRAAGPDVRHALRGGAALPAAVADGLAAVRRPLRVAVQPGRRATRASRSAGSATRFPGVRLALWGGARAHDRRPGLYAAPRAAEHARASPVAAAAPVERAPTAPQPTPDAGRRSRAADPTEPRADRRGGRPDDRAVHRARGRRRQRQEHAGPAARRRGCATRASRWSRRREPGGTPLGQALRALVLDGDDSIDPTAEALLMAADRAAARRRGDPPGARARRVGGQRPPRPVVARVPGRGARPRRRRDRGRSSAWATGGLVPDLVIVLDVTDERRGRASPGGPDRLEREGDVVPRRGPRRVPRPRRGARLVRGRRLRPRRRDRRAAHGSAGRRSARNASRPLDGPAAVGSGAMWDQVVGQDRAVAMLQRAARAAGARLPARRARAARASRPRPGASPALLIGADGDDRVLRGRHPDVVEFRPVATMYSVERDVRDAILPAVHASPIETERKCVVLLEADRLNPESSNTLAQEHRGAAAAHDHHPGRRVRGGAARHDPVALPAGRLRRARHRRAARRARAPRGPRGAGRVWPATLAGGRLDRAVALDRTARRAARRVRRRPVARSTAPARPRSRSPRGWARSSRTRSPGSRPSRRPSSTTSRRRSNAGSTRPAPRRRCASGSPTGRSARPGGPRTDALLEGITAIESVYRDALGRRRAAAQHRPRAARRRPGRGGPGARRLP